MKVKIISGVVLMTLSSLSVASGSIATSTAVSDLSRSPFQTDRDKVRTSGHLTPSVPVPPGGVIGTGTGTGEPPSPKQSAVASPARQTSTSVYNPWLTLKLQESHLLSLDIGVWAKSQGMHLLWNSNRDYLIYSAINLAGKNRDEVLNQLGQLFLSENYGLVVKLYEKNNVLVIDGQ